MHVDRTVLLYSVVSGVSSRRALLSERSGEQPSTRSLLRCTVFGVVDPVIRTRGDHLRAAITRVEVITERRHNAMYVTGCCLELAITSPSVTNSQCADGGIHRGAFGQYPDIWSVVRCARDILALELSSNRRPPVYQIQPPFYSIPIL